MNAFKRVLHPTDFSYAGRAAFAHAVKLALTARGHLYILHSTKDGAAAGNEWAEFPKVRDVLAQWDVLPSGSLEEDVTDGLGLHVTKADIGDHETVHGVTHYLAKHDCDLVVLATHGRDGLERMIGGSVAEPLARAIRLPALLLPHEAPGVINAATGQVILNNILIPIDHSPDPQRAVDAAAALISQLGAEKAIIHLLYIGDLDDEPKVSPPTGVQTQRMHGAGPVVGAILQAATQINADLIVMATHGHDGFLDVLRGSTTERVVRLAERAVLAVPV